MATISSPNENKHQMNQPRSMIPSSRSARNPQEPTVFPAYSARFQRTSCRNRREKPTEHGSSIPDRKAQYRIPTTPKESIARKHSGKQPETDWNKPGNRLFLTRICLGLNRIPAGSNRTRPTSKTTIPFFNGTHRKPMETMIRTPNRKVWEIFREIPSDFPSNPAGNDRNRHIIPAHSIHNTAFQFPTVSHRNRRKDRFPAGSRTIQRFPRNKPNSRPRIIKNLPLTIPKPFRSHFNKTPQPSLRYTGSYQTTPSI
jgi:hypothetical protein